MDIGVTRRAQAIKAFEQAMEEVFHDRYNDLLNQLNGRQTLQTLPDLITPKDREVLKRLGVSQTEIDYVNKRLQPPKPPKPTPTDYSSQVAKLRNRLTLAQDEAEIGNVFGDVEKLREAVRG